MRVKQHGIEYDVWYKIVDEKKGELKTLFHGYNGTRKIPTEKWLSADVKMVKDGQDGRPYVSGFHVLPTRQECVDYLNMFKNMKHKKIVKCIVKSTRPKMQSRHRVYLAEMLYVLP